MCPRFSMPLASCDRGTMKYRFPRWISYALLGFIVFAIAAGLYAAGASTARSSIGVAIVYGAVGVCPMSLLVGGYLYVRRYSIQIVTEGVIITNAFRARTIPFPMIKQVVTATAPCNDPPVSAQVRPLKHTPQRVFSSSAPGAAAGGCRSGSSRRWSASRGSGFRTDDDARVALSTCG